MKIKTVAVVGLGYVGLPLALALSKNFSVVGFDVNGKRIKELQEGKDFSGENSLYDAGKIIYTAEAAALKEAEMIIICVPTPIDEHNVPDLECMKSASELVGKNLSPGAVVVYESTVYPGVTEEICVPLLEKTSGWKCGEGFKVGYSPERINPGDKEHIISKVTKIVSGMDEECLNLVDSVYSTVTKTHRASSIKVAEAAKVIENIQRDLNIALMNELALIFDKMKINIHEVLKASKTKWNFHPYHPGLVGGHCIGVDPYYLTYKAESLGYHPEVILAGRKINDDMHKFYAGKILKTLAGNQIRNSSPQVYVLGLTFKPNVPDYRNSRVKYFIKELEEYHVKVFAYDPYMNQEIVEKHFGVEYLAPEGKLDEIDLIIVAVDHAKLKESLTAGKFGSAKVVYLSEL